jgi:RNA polymerase sigma-70 factor, ECF subfamily
LDFKALSSEELFLACLRDGEEVAWAEFIHRFNPLISRVVLRVARHWGEDFPEIVDELVQDTYLKLCSEKDHILREFKPTHENAVFGYVKVFAANLARDQVKARHAVKRGGTSVHLNSEEAENSQPVARGSFQESVERNLVIQRIEKCLDSIASGPLSVRDRRIFWLYYRSGLAASAIANLPAVGLSTKGVESTIFRLTRLVRAQLMARSVEVNTELGRKGMQRSDSL